MSQNLAPLPKLLLLLQLQDAKAAGVSRAHAVCGRAATASVV